MSIGPARRWKLRNLDAPQKLLVGVIVGTVLSGYLAALLNLFAQHSEADGKATIHLEEFLDTYKKEGISAVVNKVQESLGMEDVIRHYHGSGGATQLQAVLNGSMKSMISDALIKEQGKTPEAEKQAESLRQMLIQWSNLPEDVRKSAYEEGTPVNDDGLPVFDPKKDGDKVTVVKDTLQGYCVRCHSTSGEAKEFPLADYSSVVKYWRWTMEFQ